MDGVLLCEADCEGSLERVQVGEKGVDKGGRCGAFEEEHGLGVLIWEGGAFGKDAGRAGRFGLAAGLLGSSLLGRKIEDSRLTPLAT